MEDQAIEQLRTSIDLNPVIHAGLGDKDKAFEWLERAYQARSYLLAVYLNTDARLTDGLMSFGDPRTYDPPVFTRVLPASFGLMCAI